MAAPALEVDGVRKSYGRRRPVVDDMTFDIRAGELFGFVGSNGAGKTTTMRIVLGVLAPDAGEVRWLGRPVDFAARRRFGYMPEERGLYPRMKVDEHLRYLGELHGLSPAAARSAAGRWIERLELSGYASEEVQNLSLGNQQRVQLARRWSTDLRCWCSTSPSPASTRWRWTSCATCSPNAPPRGVSRPVLQPPAVARRADLRQGRHRRRRTAHRLRDGRGTERGSRSPAAGRRPGGG